MRTSVVKANTIHAMFIDDDAATNMLHIIAAQNVKLADETTAHTSAVDALDELKHTPTDDFPSYIFVDVNMPQMNGHEFMTALKSGTHYNPDETCVIFLTGSLDIKDLVRADENEVKRYH
jgi:CheY-like chemotaxis protein